MIRLATLTAVAATAFALPALAGEVALDRALSAGSLHEGGVDLVAYYLPAADGALEVTVTFAAAESGAPARVVMAMADGDALRFALPGHRGTLYGFARSGDRVTVTATPVATPATGATEAEVPAASEARL